MKTFHVEIHNLGPIRAAVFDASHMNVVCGKNNTGKSILLHTIYCLLTYWRFRIPLRLEKSDELQMLSVGDATIDYGKYVDELNSRIGESMPEFIKEIPALLCKDLDVANTRIVFEIDRGYARSCFAKLSYSFPFEISKDAAFTVSKMQNTAVVRHVLINKTGATLDENAVMNAFRYVASMICHAVLPMPILLTAERAGSLMYGADVLSYGFQLSQGSIAQNAMPSHRYPYALIQEMQFLQNAKQGNFESRNDPFSGMARSLDEDFSKRITHGRFVVNAGKIYYCPDGSATERLIDIEATSTSVKSLVGLSFFVRSLNSFASLLMIDEPELNLHPERQRELTRFLARLVNVGGAGVAITTHSPTIVRELNTLIAFGSNTEKYAQEIGKFKYSGAELLPADVVSCGIVDDGQMRQMPVETHSGFFVDSFDEASDEISAVQAAIVQKWNA